MSIDSALRAELLSMAEEDGRVRTELAADGSLFEGYHPRMERVHRRNGTRLLQIIERTGWPGRDRVGVDGADAAWLVLQHAIGMPALQRLGLKLLHEERARGTIDPAQVAMLEDRICHFEGREQVYGTQYDWDEDGELSPSPIRDPDSVDERRRAVGLGPLAENTRRMREAVSAAGESAPADVQARKKAQREWAASVGWLDPRGAQDGSTSR